MTTMALPSQTPVTLRRLREYAALYRLYIAKAEQSQLPPLHIRTSFKRCECCLPTGLVQYVVWLFRCGISNPLTTMDRKGRCVACRQAAHPEWRMPISRGEVVFICGRCGRIFVPERSDQEEVS